MQGVQEAVLELSKSKGEGGIGIEIRYYFNAHPILRGGYHM